MQKILSISDGKNCIGLAPDSFKTGALVLVTIVFVLLSASHALCDDNSMRSLWKNAHTQEDRLQLAKEIRTNLKVDELLRLVPKVSPRVEGWLSGELKASSDRVMAALSSPEYSNRQARLAIESIDWTLRQIDERKDDAMAQWVGLASLLMDAGLVENLGIICERKVISSCPLGETKHARMMATTVSGMYARTIVLGVIGPKFGTGFLE